MMTRLGCKLGTCWLARLLRGRRLDRNPLRRGSDRAETVVLAALLAAFLAGAPFAAHTAGSLAYATYGREAQAQRAVLRQVPATLLQAPPTVTAIPGAGVIPLGVNARWRAPDGQLRTGLLFVPSGATAGSTVPVWVNQVGQLADPPLGRAQLATRAQLARELTAGTLAVVLIVIGWLARRSLDRRRMAAWDADWLATGSRWTPRRLGPMGGD
jgi:nitrate reductase gamma subunit